MYVVPVQWTEIFYCFLCKHADDDDDDDDGIGKYTIVSTKLKVGFAAG
jgi:hypothetical protein